MANLLDLAKRMEQRAKEVGLVASEKGKQIAIGLVTDLAYRTPVDTSKALSNWQVTIGSPALGVINAYSPGYLGYTQTPSALATIEAAKAAVVAKKPGQVIYITNNVDYIKKLNSGSSRQAPAGFVEAATLIARKRIRENG